MVKHIVVRTHTYNSFPILDCRMSTVHTIILLGDIGEQRTPQITA
jgi:hypothetical protein